MSCSNNLKQMGLACHNYHDARNVLPPALTGSTSTVESTIRYTTLHVYLLPYIEQDNLYKLFPAKQTTFTAYYALGTNQVKAYLCPGSTSTQSLSSSEASGGVRNLTTHYYANLGPLGDNTGTSPVTQYPVRAIGSQGGYSLAGPLVVSSVSGGSSQGYALTGITDGTSNTLLLGESSKNNWKHYRSWIRGWDSDSSAATVTGKNVVYTINSTDYASGNFNNVSLSSNHSGGVNVALCDGSVRSVRDSIPLDALKRLASRSGGEIAAFE